MKKFLPDTQLLIHSILFLYSKRFNWIQVKDELSTY